MATDLFNLLGSITINTSGFEQALNQAQNQTKKLEERMKNMGSSMQDVGSQMTSSISLPFAALGTGAIMAAAHTEDVLTQIKNATASTTAEAEKLTDVAKSIYKQGFGESLPEVADALIQVKQNMQSLKGEELEEATRNAVILAKTFDTSVNEVTRGAQSLMNAFGVSSEKAFDKLASSTNLNMSGDLFDQVNEFSSVAQRYGYTMDEYFNLMQRGSQAGVYNMDRINNAILEFGLSAEDGSKGTHEAFSHLSKSTQQLWQDMLAGKATSAELSQAVIQELIKMDDQLLADQIGIGLWKTNWEDNTKDVMYAMYDVNNAIAANTQTMDEMADAAEETFGVKWKNFTRTAQSSLEPLGVVLIDIAEEWLPKIAKALESVATWFANLSPAAQKAIVAIGGIATIAGPLIMILGTLVSSIGSIIGMFGRFMGAGSALTGVLGRILPIILRFIPGVGLVVTAFSLLTGVFETFGIDIMAGLGNGVKEGLAGVLGAFATVGNQILDFFRGLFGIASPSKVFIGFGKDIMQGLINGIRSLVGSVTRLFGNLFGSIKRIASSGISSLKNTVGAGFSSIASGARNMASNITSSVSGAFSSALATAQSFASKAVSLGSDIAGGISSGISKGKEKVGNAISSLSKKAMSVFKKDNEIASPSKLYEREAGWLPEGITKGITGGQSNVLGAMSDLVKNTNARFMDMNWDSVQLPSMSGLLSNIGTMPFKNMATSAAIGNQTTMPAPIVSNADGANGINYNIEGGLHIHVDQVSDLNKQQLQNQVERVFMSKARQKV